MDDLKTRTKCDFIDLLWEDILFGRVFPYLSIRDLFVVRGLSRKYRLLINTYFKQMKCIRLGSYSKEFSPEAFKVLAKNCHNLKEVMVANSPWLTDEMIAPIFENNKFLKRIVLNHCHKLTSKCLHRVIMDCKELESLCLANCVWLTIGCFQIIILHLTTLVHIDFSGCPLVDYVELINNFIRVSPGLKSLNISQMYCVDDSTLAMCARTAKNLEHLNINQCSKVTGYGVSLVMEHCMKLKALMCIGCPLVTKSSLRSKPRPNLLFVPGIINPSGRAICCLPRLNV